MTNAALRLRGAFQKLYVQENTLHFDLLPVCLYFIAFYKAAVILKNIGVLKMFIPDRIEIAGTW